MFCILVISENNNSGLFCTLPALISRFFKWTEIKFILSRDTQKHLTFYLKFIPVLLQNTVKSEKNIDIIVDRARKRTENDAQKRLQIPPFCVTLFEVSLPYI